MLLRLFIGVPGIGDDAPVPIYTNAAGRLENIMGEILEGNQNAAIQSTLARVLDATEPGTLLRKIALLFDLYDEAKAEAEQHTDDEWFLDWCDPIRSALQETVNLTTALNSLTRHYTRAHVKTLGALARQLPLRRDFDVRQVSSLLDSARSLQSELLEAADLPAELKTFLLGLVGRLIQGLIDFSVAGPDGILHATDEVTGTVWRTRSLVEQGTSGDGRFIGFLRKLFGIVQRAEQVATASQSVLELPPALADAIGALENLG